MSNPKSPHAAANKGGWKPKIMRDGKPVQDGQEVMGVAKVVTPPKKSDRSRTHPNTKPEIAFK